MLRRNNTAFRRLWRAKLWKPPILAAMDDSEDLARRFFALWGEYQTALAGDPQTLDLWRRWLTQGAATPAGEPATTRPAPRAAAPAGPSGEHDAAVAEL